MVEMKVISKEKKTEDRKMQRQTETNERQGWERNEGEAERGREQRVKR